MYHFSAFTRARTHARTHSYTHTHPRIHIANDSNYVNITYFKYFIISYKIFSKKNQNKKQIFVLTSYS